MTKHLFIFSPLCCLALSGCVATVQESKTSDEAPGTPALAPQSETQSTPKIPPLPGVGGVNAPAPVPPVSS